MPIGKGGHMKIKKITAFLLAAALATSTFTGCTLDKNATVATLDKQDISLGLVNFIVRLQQASFDDVYIQYGGVGYWNEDLSGQGTPVEMWKQNTIEQVHECYTLKAHMDEYGVKISDEEKKKIEDTAKEFIKDNSKEAIEELGATQEIVEEYLELQLIKNKMYKAIVAKADTEVTDEEANMASYTMLQIDYSGYYDSSYNRVPYSEDEAEQIKEQGNAIAEAVSQGQSLEDAVSAFGMDPASVITSGTYATYVDESATASKDTESEEEESTQAAELENAQESVYTANTIDQSIVDALNELEEGETSGLIDTGSAYVIVRLESKTDSEATESNRQTIKGNKEDKYYNEQIDKWQEKEDWDVKESQLDKIKIHNYFTTIDETEAAEDGSGEDATEVVDEVESTESGDVTETTEETEETQTVEE